MRILIFALLFGVAASVSLASLSATPAAAGPSRVELLQTVRHIESLAKELQTDLDKEKAAHASATTQNGELQQAIDKQAEQLNKAIAERDHILKKLHLAKIIVSAVASALVIFVVLRLGIPPPLMFYVIGVAIAAVNAAVWIFL